MASNDTVLNDGASDNVAAPVPAPQKTRLLSLDVLRGFDLFFLCGFGGILWSFSSHFESVFANNAFLQGLQTQFSHVDWEGFQAEDLIMPLFMFMSGVTISFSFSKYLEKGDPDGHRKLYGRLFRRIALLWIFGMIAQGHLLNMRYQGLLLFSNTLQAIAAGYLIASIVYIPTGRYGLKWHLIAFFALMFIFWVVMNYVKVTYQGAVYGWGDYSPTGNFAEFVDRLCLGRFRDGVIFHDDGSWEFGSHHYTWVFSSLTFGATVLSGLMCGEVIRNAKKASHAVGLGLFGVGVLMTAVGYFWGKVPAGVFGYCPLVKHLWTPSMVFFSSGLSTMLLGFFYEFYDVLQFHSWKINRKISYVVLIMTVAAAVLSVMRYTAAEGTWLSSPCAFKTIVALFAISFIFACLYCKLFWIVIGMNSIFLYSFVGFLGTKQVPQNVLYGLEQYIGPWHSPLMAILGFAFTWFIMWLMYKNKYFIRL